jgi:hypothetical protein
MPPLVRSAFASSAALPEADDLVDGKGARAHAALVTAAVHLLGDPDARPTAADVEGADSLRAVHLVRGDARQIDVHLVDRERDLPHRLHGVRVEEHAALATDGADLADGLDDADLVVRGHHRDEHGVVAQRRLHRGGIDEAFLVDVEVGDLPAFALERVAGIEHRLVLDLVRDDVLALRLVELGHARDGRLSDSVAPEVNTISLAVAPMSAATCSGRPRPPSLAAQPKAWFRLAAFPYTSVR